MICRTLTVAFSASIIGEVGFNGAQQMGQRLRLAGLEHVVDLHPMVFRS